MLVIHSAEVQKPVQGKRIHIWICWENPTETGSQSEVQICNSPAKPRFGYTYKSCQNRYSNGNSENVFVCPGRVFKMLKEKHQDRTVTNTKSLKGGKEKSLNTTMRRTNGRWEENKSSDTKIRFKTKLAYNEMCIGQCSKCLTNNGLFSPHNKPGMQILFSSVQSLSHVRLFKTP